MSWVLLTLLVIASSVLVHCGGTNILYPGQSMILYSPNHPYSYPVPYSCVWAFSSPTPVNFTIKCTDFNVFQTDRCSVDYLEVERADLTKIRYCGFGQWSHAVFSNNFNVGFRSSTYKTLMRYKTYYRFSCTVIATQATVTAKPSTATPTSAPTAAPIATPTAAPTAAPTATPTTTPATSTLSSAVSTTNSSSVTNSTFTNSTKCSCGRKNTQSRIVGGQNASMNEYPYQCMLTTLSGAQYCGCSLICQKYILTASHCVDGSVASNVMVVLGDHQKNNATETQSIKVGVKNIIMHENYDKTTVNNDIALLELAKPVNYTNTISPVCLPFGKENFNVSGVTGTVSGWGTTSSGGNDSLILKEVDIPLLTTNECKTYYQSAITNNMICTYQPGKDSCQGDSGGPLVMQDKDGSMCQLGVVSWGVGCAEPGKPGVYTKLVNYLPWIKSKTNNSTACDFCQP